MSMLTGKCDLYDEIYMIGGEGKTEEEAFDDFLRRTGGVIYMSKQAEVTDRNEDLLISMTNGVLSKAPDGKRHHYVYMGTLYRSLKAVNRFGGVFIRVPLHFSSELELLPYYGHLVSSMMSSSEDEQVCITEEPYPLITDQELLYYGIDNGFAHMATYMKMLAEETESMVRRLPARAAADACGEASDEEAPYARNLDGIYFRLCRGGRPGNVCLTDMTQKELAETLAGCNRGKLLGVCTELARTLRRLGDSFSIEADDNGN